MRRLTDVLRLYNYYETTLHKEITYSIVSDGFFFMDGFLFLWLYVGGRRPSCMVGGLDISGRIFEEIR